MRNRSNARAIRKRCESDMKLKQREVDARSNAMRRCEGDTMLFRFVRGAEAMRKANQCKSDDKLKAMRKRLNAKALQKCNN
jgi:hypothetical protein